jgi:hypothetical protein
MHNSVSAGERLEMAGMRPMPLAIPAIQIEIDTVTLP